MFFLGFLRSSNNISRGNPLCVCIHVCFAKVFIPWLCLTVCQRLPKLGRATLLIVQKKCGIGTAQSQEVGVDPECVLLQSLLFQVIFSVRLATEWTGLK